MQRNPTLKQAIEFHGHLGPYLVLGLLAGATALKRLKGKKYFGVDVKVYGANKKPKSCLVDGLQLSTGATYGKGNISKYNSKSIKVIVCNCIRGNSVTLTLKDEITAELKGLKGHIDSERFAKVLLNKPPQQVFSIK